MSTASSPQEILVLHGGALGDCVLTLHAARRCRSARPRTRVTVAARSGIVKWAAQNDLIDVACALDPFSVDLWRPANTAASPELRNFLSGFDWIISFLGDSTAAVSETLRTSFGGKVSCVDPRPADSGPLAGLHLVDQWCSKFGGLHWSGACQPADPVAVRVGSGSRTSLVEKVSANTERIVLIHPGSGGLSKCCPLDALVGLIPAFRQSGWTPAWMIGPDEVERFGDPFLKRLERQAAVVYEESVVAAADLAAAADAYVGCDAGMTHVAALAGVNTVALFGPTDPRIWRPLGRSVQVLGFPGHGGHLDEWNAQIASAARAGAS